MRYLWILLIPVLAFAQWGDKDSDRDVRNRGPEVGDRQSTEPHPDIDLSLEGFEERAGKRGAQALSDQVPWEQIERWKWFDELSNHEIFIRLDKRGPAPGETNIDWEKTKEDLVEWETRRDPRPTYAYGRYAGWAKFFNPTRHGPKEVHMQRFLSIPKRKRARTFGGGRRGPWTYLETCREFNNRIRKYWFRWHRNVDYPDPPCELEPLQEEVRQREVLPDPEPFKPPPITTTEDIQGAPTIDEGARTTYSAEDGRPVQGQNAPGHHRARGSATLSSGRAIVDLNTSVGAGRNDMSFLDLNFVGHARSTDTSNANTYTVYALSKSKILIKSSSGTDTSTVNFTVEGQ